MLERVMAYWTCVASLEPTLNYDGTTAEVVHIGNVRLRGLLNQLERCNVSKIRGNVLRNNDRLLSQDHRPLRLLISQRVFVASTRNWTPASMAPLNIANWQNTRVWRECNEEMPQCGKCVEFFCARAAVLRLAPVKRENWDDRTTPFGKAIEND